MEEVRYKGQGEKFVLWETTRSRHEADNVGSRALFR